MSSDETLYLISVDGSGYAISKGRDHRAANTMVVVGAFQIVTREEYLKRKALVDRKAREISDADPE